jgi:hypothetical protein
MWCGCQVAAKLGWLPDTAWHPSGLVGGLVVALWQGLFRSGDQIPADALYEPSSRVPREWRHRSKR